MPSPSREPKPFVRRTMPRMFLLKITKDTAEQLPNFPIREKNGGYFIACDPAEPVRYGDHVAVENEPGKWIIGVVDTKYPEKTKKVSVAFGTVPGVPEQRVSFDRGEVVAVTGYQVNLRARARQR